MSTSQPLQDSARTIRSLSRLTPVAIRPHSELPTLSDNVIDSYETVLAMLQPGIYSVQPGADRAMGVIVGEDVEVSPEHFVRV